MALHERKLRVNVTVKRAIDCPPDAADSSVYVKLKWAPRALWGGKEHKTSCVRTERFKEDQCGIIVEWNEDFTFECSVKLRSGVASDEEDVAEEALAHLRKKQTSLAHLRMSLCKEKVGTSLTGDHKLGFFDISLLDWAVLYGNGKEHNVQKRLDGTTSCLELAVCPYPLLNVLNTHFTTNFGEDVISDLRMFAGRIMTMLLVCYLHCLCSQVKIGWLDKAPEKQVECSHALQ